MIDLTILLATHNGANVLPRTFEGYVQQKNPGFDWKLIVVDNGSNDGTSDVIERYRSKLKLEKVVEPVPGKNRALNRGLSGVEGDIILISDDDAIPQPGFLTAWRNAFDRTHGYDVFGGSIDPLFDVAPPEWMAKSEIRFTELFASRRNLPEGPIDAIGIFGPNMAVRRSVIADGVRFNEGIGPNGADPNYAIGSEHDFCLEAVRRGHKTWFAAEPTVWHIVRAHQLTSEYWQKRAYRLGRGVAQRQWDTGVVTARRNSRARIAAITGRFAMHRMLLRAQTFTPIPLEKFKAIWAYHFYRGYHDEHLRRRNLTGSRA
jgi:glycosyltransferase involved in cell wall biosynthesis